MRAFTQKQVLSDSNHHPNRPWVLFELRRAIVKLDRAASFRAPHPSGLVNDAIAGDDRRIGRYQFLQEGTANGVCVLSRQSRPPAAGADHRVHGLRKVAGVGRSIGRGGAPRMRARTQGRCCKTPVTVGC